jgi:hypothetical protein
MGETAETLRNHHHASKKPGELSHLDPESYLTLPPMMTVKLRLSRLPFIPTSLGERSGIDYKRSQTRSPSQLVFTRVQKHPAECYRPSTTRWVVDFDAAIAK